MKRGTPWLVGIRSPSLSKGISGPGYHRHFILDELRKVESAQHDKP
ncbi:acetolactate decarboxylase [Massilia scottii]|nr:acetolactate decarboxylase [Massilia sp. CCM 9029]MDQ1829748.1 acetolactate decarboxylase [Massilia sp. CCM 9029]